MTTLFRDQDGSIKQVIESTPITAEYIDNEIAEAKLALQRAEELKEQFIRTSELGNVGGDPTPMPEPVATPQVAPVEQAVAPTPAEAEVQPTDASVASEPQIAPVDQIMPAPIVIS